MQELNICVLMGGWSNEREISLASGASVLSACQELYTNAWGLDLRSVADLGQLIVNKPDVCFIALHGMYGEDGKIQAWLELHNIPYTGSNVLSSSIAMNKVMTKRLWQAAGLPVLNTTLVTKVKDIENRDLVYPVCVKPNFEGSSIGVVKAEDYQELHTAVLKLLPLHSQLIIEPWLNGPEYTVGVLNDKALPIIKIEVQDRFYDFNNKYTKGGHKKIIPCGLNNEKLIQKQALQACKVLGISGMARVDLMFNQSNEWFFLEVNTIPGLTAHSLLPAAANAAGVDFTKLVQKVVYIYHS